MTWFSPRRTRRARRNIIRALKGNLLFLLRVLRVLRGLEIVQKQCKVSAILVRPRDEREMIFSHKGTKAQRSRWSGRKTFQSHHPRFWSIPPAQANPSFVPLRLVRKPLRNVFAPRHRPVCLNSLLRKSRDRAGRDCAGGQGALTAAMPKRIAKEAQRRPTDARAARPEGCGAFPAGVRWTTADRPPWGMPLSSACSAGKIARNAAYATFSTGC